MFSDNHFSFPFHVILAYLCNFTGSVSSVMLMLSNISSCS